jgi:predicted nucleotidyltransferase
MSAGLTQQQVANRCGMSQSHVAAYEAGRRPISADQENRIVLALRRSPSQVLREHAAEVRSIAAQHGAERVYVFGSVARGEDSFDSDIDLLVKLRPGVGLFDLVAMRNEIETLLGRPVDIVSEAALKPRDDDIRREAVAL